MAAVGRVCKIEADVAALVPAIRVDSGRGHLEARMRSSFRWTF